MTKEFEKRVKLEGMVDTKKYRYRLVQEPDFYGIIRIEIDKLDTAAAITDWKVVKTF